MGLPCNLGSDGLFKERGIMKLYYVKLLFLIFVFLLLQIKCEAQSQYSNALSKMEKTLFNMDYNSQSDEVRLMRIEENVYGSTSKNSITARVNKLSKVLSADLIGQEIKPNKDSFLEDDEIISKPQQDMNFALVNSLERKIFKYEFKTVDISHRLLAMEGQVFKKNYSADDLSTRINRLNNAVMYNKFPTDDNTIAQTPISQQKILPVENKQIQKLFPIPNSIDKQEQILDPNIKLVSLEKSVLAESFPNEKNSNRLTRLESKIFNSTFVNDDEQTRLNRIESANQAKSSLKKYNSNRASQRTATAIQLGTILLMLLPLLL